MPRTQDVIFSAFADQFELDKASAAATNVTVKLNAASIPYLFLRKAR